MKILVSLVVLLLGPAAALHCNVCVSHGDSDNMMVISTSGNCRLAWEVSVPTATAKRRPTAGLATARQSSTGELRSPSYTPAPTVGSDIETNRISFYLDMI